MKPDLLCRHGLLPSRSLLRQSLFNHAHDVALLGDDVILAVGFDLGTRPFSEQHSIADFDIQRMQFAVISNSTRPSGNDFAFHWLFLGGIGDDNAALGLLLLLDAADQNAILQRSKFHWSPARTGTVTCATPHGRRAGFTQQFNTTTSMGRLTLNVL